MLEVRDVVKTYDGRAVVNHVSFEVAPGEIFALLGPNGAGKTTLIRMITDILRPDSGTVMFEGEPMGSRRARISYLPEERGLYRRSRVVDVLVYYGELKGMSPAEARTDAMALLQRVELAEWANKQVQVLSKGMQQKVQLCTALIASPRVLILDEPFSGLDPVNVQLLEDILQDVRSRGAIVLLSTHQMNKVEQLCDRALMIHHGHMVLYGPVREIRRKFADHAVLVRSHGPIAPVAGVRAVEAVDGDQKLVLEASALPQDVLRALIERGVPIESFSIASLPLEDLFIKVVREGLGLDRGQSGTVQAEELVAGGAR
jgi:ABC-2 type transport system ATP-binding protein